MTFDTLGLSKPILKALDSEGYHTPTPIQAKAIPHILAGNDVLGCAQTGTGKTAAFALPMLHILAEKPSQRAGKRPIRALILTPTRELALQIKESFEVYGQHLPLRHLVIFGGVGQTPQTDALRAGTDILVATPGRLLDLMQQGFIQLNDVAHFVLDEADRMLDMGFLNDVKKVIAKLPKSRQSLFFSATMAPDILSLAATILNNPVKVEVTPISSTAETVQQSVYFVDKENKKKLLVHLLNDQSLKSVLVFTRTKHGANRLVQDLEKSQIAAEAIHGNKSQQARQRALIAFKSKELRILVATDIAARGIDVEELSHVINYELPNIPETYVHRIGRTGRAGASGIAIAFCDGEEREFLRDIQKLIGQQIPQVAEHPFPSEDNSPIQYPSVRMSQAAQKAKLPSQKPVQKSNQQPNTHQNTAQKPDNQPSSVKSQKTNAEEEKKHWRPWKYRKHKSKPK
ncbi:MAG: DEAD/DEAH box helicase [Spirosomaceae bacterium]|jgi:ATP-dependent RNA helicase RhlE|nr:DEAD/DEAH box helicase [Spirosomataceae bacterium]